MENSIGEGLSRVYIRYADISNRKLNNMLSLVELEKYIKKHYLSIEKNHY
ncbi:hypothetical protein [Brachyspira hampsonii]|nr:hypothetical protein [Brachyspira hampsonii]